VPDELCGVASVECEQVVRHDRVQPEEAVLDEEMFGEDEGPGALCAEEH
jgi:hypothetical protein